MALHSSVISRLEAMILKVSLSFGKPFAICCGFFVAISLLRAWFDFSRSSPDPLRFFTMIFLQVLAIYSALFAWRKSDFAKIAQRLHRKLIETLEVKSKLEVQAFENMVLGLSAGKFSDRLEALKSVYAEILNEDRVKMITDGQKKFFVLGADVGQLISLSD